MTERRRRRSHHAITPSSTSTRCLDGKEAPPAEEESVSFRERLWESREEVLTISSHLGVQRGAEELRPEPEPPPPPPPPSDTGMNKSCAPAAPKRLLVIILLTLSWLGENHQRLC